MMLLTTRFPGKVSTVTAMKFYFRRENSKLVSNQDNLPEFEEAPAYKPQQQPTQKSSKSN